MSSDGVIKGSGEPLAMTSDSSISAAKLLHGVEKSYDSGKKLLEESRMAEREGGFEPGSEYGAGADGDIRFRGIERINAHQQEMAQTSPEAKSDHAVRMSKKFNTPIRIVNDPNELKSDNAERQARMRRSKGFYDPATGEVVVVVPNNATVEDMAETVFHEVVAHRGLREMIGEENYDAFCDEVYGHLKDDLKKGIDEKTTRRFVNEPEKGYEHHRRVAVDEMFGRMAEKGFEDFTKAERGVWAKLKAKVLEAINKFLGSLKLPKWVQLGDNELRYMLWRSHERLRTKGDYVDMARDTAKREELELRRNEAVRERFSYRFRDGESELDANTQAVVDVFSGRADNAAIEVERADGRRRVVMRQGDENRAGTKHALFRHFETKSNYITADDIAMVPEVIAKGERTVNGKKVAYDYVAEDGSRLRVATEIHGAKEQFTNFLSNREPLQEKSVENTQSAHRSNTEVSDAKVENNSQSDKPEGALQRLRTSDGVVYGWTEGGKTYLNRDAMNPETPLHEYTHLWDDMVRRENPELWERGKELMKQTPLWEEAVNDPTYADIRNDEDAIASEVHSLLTGKRGAERIETMMREAAAEPDMVEKAEKFSILHQLKSWLQDMFKGLKKTLSKWSKRDLRNLTAEDFADLTLRDLADGLIAKGEHTVNGKKVAYDYETEDGSRLRVATELRDNTETFVSLYTNRKSSEVESSSVANNAVVTRHHSGAQSLNPEVSDAKVENNSQSDKSEGGLQRFAD